MPGLHDPITIGDLELPNRVIMAPLTRCRASGGGRVPNSLMAQYYAQRATAGLILTEATVVDPTGIGYPDTPGIWTSQQVDGWKLVTEAVHSRGGRIFLQLWHVGRVSHSSLQPGGVLPVAPSAVPITGEGMLAMTASGKPEPYETPRALQTHEIADVIEAFRQGARNAFAAGFDGVEIHGANGYLLEQFLQSHTNLRTDRYGGSIANRARLLLEIMDAAIGIWGTDRVAVRLSPYGVANGSGEPDPMPLYSHVIGALDALVEIAPVIDGRCRLLLDSGVRSGADVFKALALGADAVLIGRPYLYGLALAGEAGARDVVRNIIAEFDLTLGLSGLTSLSELTPEALRRI